jgi:superfamily II DNA helicase RecQ
VVYGIPCGVGNSDYGFIVKGTGHEDVNNREPFPSVHALVYNFLIRDSHITREAYPQYMKNHPFNHELDYGHVYRLIMILIDLLNPVGVTELRLNVIGDRDELTAAVDILNEYLAVFGRLTKSQLCSVKVIDDLNGRSISAITKADYCVKNFDSDQGLRRRIRYGSRINYSLDKTDRGDLEFLLREISPFKSFKKGQYDALCSMMNANGHAVCIMPTGSGKSLIYYFACLLQPQTVFVVSPTDILIRDQIRNLRKFHHFDNVTHLDLTGKNDFSFFKMATNLIFLTPATFQNRNLFGIFKQWKNEISYVVLDEIHCLSNWGHDFRPEYLMLSKNMSQYLENARYLGFTATANYTVAQDIQKQLSIPFDNFFSPVLFEKYNVRYSFREVDSMEAMYEQIRVIADDIVQRNERAIVFTKNDEISVKVADAIGYEADVFTSDNSEAYAQFAEGLCRILVASEDLGIGVNLPNVNCTIHFGMPVSKNEFVQEIGRAGRAEEKVTAYVVYLKPSEENIPAVLLKRETIVDNLPQMLKAMNNDYADVYHKLNCGADTSDVLYDRLIDIYSDFHSGQKTAYIVDRPVKSIEIYKQLIYMLYVTGYVKDWYTYRAVESSDAIELIIDICSVPNTGGHKVIAIDDASMLERMRKKSRDYFASMGNDRESIFKVSKAQKIEDILRTYVDWYYEKFLYHHKEQFLDLFEFLTTNKDGDSVKITEEIEDYFTLPFIQIKEDEEYYSNMTMAELSDQVIKGIGKNTLSNIERINSNNYSYKLDYLLFVGNWSRAGRFDATRLERFWGKLAEDEKQIFFMTMAELYSGCTSDAKWSYLKYIDDKQNITGLRLAQVVDAIYRKTQKDKVFYGILARTANKKFSEFMR